MDGLVTAERGRGLGTRPTAHAGAGRRCRAPWPFAVRLRCPAGGACGRGVGLSPRFAAPGASPLGGRSAAPAVPRRPVLPDPVRSRRRSCPGYGLSVVTVSRGSVPWSRSCGRPFLSSLLCARPSLSDQRRGPRAHTAVRCTSARPRVRRPAGPQPRPEGPSLPTGAPSLCLRWVTFPVTSVDTVSRFFPGGPPGSPDVPPSRQRLRMVVDFCCS